MGSSGPAVISFQEQITFPAAKDMLSLNKNGNSRQTELGTGSGRHFPLQALAGACGERGGVGEGRGLYCRVQLHLESRSMGSYHKAPAPHILQDPALASHLPVPCPDTRLS